MNNNPKVLSKKKSIRAQEYKVSLNLISKMKHINKWPKKAIFNSEDAEKVRDKNLEKIN